MNNKYFSYPIYVIWANLILVSCASPVPIRTISSAPAMTSEASATIPLARPTTSPMPSSTPGFAPHGPILVFEDETYNPSKIILFDPVLQTRFEISKPEAGILHWNADGLSPDGQLFAYYSGHLDRIENPSVDPSAPQKIELNIIRTLDGSVVFQTPILNSQYPQIFLQAADSLISNPVAGFDAVGQPREQLASTLLSAFQSTIYTYRWSPDGRLFAFASGAGGPSSDVYTYNVETSAVTRITDGPSEVYRMHWSPDGKSILNSGVFTIGEGTCGTWYLSSIDGSGSTGFSIKGGKGSDFVGGCIFSEWVSDHQALVHESTNGRGDYNLEILDTTIHTIDLLWPHIFHSFTFNPNTNQVLVSTVEEVQRDATYFPQGTYQVDVLSHKSISIGTDMTSLTYLGWGLEEAVAGIPHDLSYDVCFFSSLRCTVFPTRENNQTAHISASPNRKHLVLFSDLGLWLIYPAADNKTAKREFSGIAQSLQWAPNPGSPDNDIAIFQDKEQYILYIPGTHAIHTLPDFSGRPLAGWRWRE